MEDKPHSSKLSKDLSPARRAALDRRLSEALELSARPTSIPVRKRQEFAPLSFAQEGLWVLSQFDLHHGLFNRPVVIRLTGALDRSNLEAALFTVVRRHKALCYRLRSDIGEPLQQIARPEQLSLIDVDFRGLDADQREYSANQYVNEQVINPIDLTCSPLMRASLIHLTENQHILVLVFHHITFDAWSEGVLLADLSAVYNGLVSRNPAQLPDLRIQYADFAAWQRDRLESGALNNQLDYWKHKLENLPSPLDLTPDFRRPSIYASRGAAHTFDVSADMVPLLKTLAASENATLFMVLLAGFVALIHRITNQTDFVIGTPIAGRTYIETENLIGLFINTLVLRFDISGRPTFSNLLHRVRDEALEAYSNQDIPFEKIVDVVPFHRDLSRPPFFQILFNFENLPERQKTFSGLKVEPYSYEQTYARYDLSLEFTQINGSLRGEFIYNTQIYKKATVEWISEFLS